MGQSIGQQRTSGRNPPARFAVYVPLYSRWIMRRRASAALSLLPWRCCRSSIRNRAASAPSGASSMIRAASSGVVYRAPSGGVHGLESLRKVRFIFFILYSFLKISINRREGRGGQFGISHSKAHQSAVLGHSAPPCGICALSPVLVSPCFAFVGYSNRDFCGRRRGRRAVLPHMLHRCPICRADLPPRFQARAGGLIVLVE